MGNCSIKELCKRLLQIITLSNESHIKTVTKDDYEFPLISQQDQDMFLSPIHKSNNFGLLSRDSLSLIKSKKLTSGKQSKNNLEDFKVLKLLGIGSFGKVFLVKSIKDNKHYAMKVLFKGKILRKLQAIHTMNERKILEKINFPFIVKLYYAFQDAEKLYLVTEFMQGGELFFFLKTRGRLPEKEVKLYAAEIILALQHLHDKNIIYRDLKPENILLDDKGYIKITDFGLSKIIQESKEEEEQVAYTLCGTPEYLAPEVILGQGYSKEVDWWSFGVVLYEMLTGHVLFQRKIQTQIDIQMYLKPIDLVKIDISQEAKDLVLLLLRLDSKKRLTNIKNIKSHLFFKDINWDDVFNKRITHAFVPNIKLPDDVNYFEKRFTSNTKDLIIFNKDMQPKELQMKKISKFQFNNFSFVREVNIPSE